MRLGPAPDSEVHFIVHTSTHLPSTGENINAVVRSKVTFVLQV